jgi:transposase InsO family protein
MGAKNALDRPEVQRRLRLAAYAQAFGIRAAARQFGVSRNRVRRTLKRVSLWQCSGEVSALLNQPRGQVHALPTGVEASIVAYYQDSQGRRSCPNIGRRLWAEQQLRVSRQTIWNVLRRCGVYRHGAERRAVQRFAMERPNMLWQVDLKEEFPTAIGNVYGIALLDDCSRFLVFCRFFQDKSAEHTAYAFYQAFQQYGLPDWLLSDRGSQFWCTNRRGRSAHEKIMSRLGICMRLQHLGRPQEKGKVEKFIQFWTRDFLALEGPTVTSLEDLNQRANAWRDWYNQHHAHEALGFREPARCYVPGRPVCPEVLQAAFTQEVQRKVRADATITYQGLPFQVPARYIGWNVFVHTVFGHMHIYAGMDMKLIAEHHYPWA